MKHRIDAATMRALINGRRPLKRFRLRTFLLATLCVMASMGLFVTQAPPAAAASEVCVAASDLTTACAYVHGSGGTVTYVEGIGDIATKSLFPTICGYRTHVRISGNGNPNYAQYDNAVPLNACAWYRAVNRVNINRTFPKGFYVCTSYFIHGNQQQGREICIKLT